MDARTQQQRTRDRSRSSQRKASIDIYSDRNSQIPEPTNSGSAGTKRLFSNRQSRISYNSDHGENEEPDSTPAVHSEKRHRSGDWPLPASSPVERGPLRNRNAPNSPTLRRSSAQKRPSKFLEGSMNDRVSQKPPVPYLGDEEELLEEYNAEQREHNGKGKKARPQSCAPHSNLSTTGTDTSRHSSIFRFGKSIAASFNPSNWKLFKSHEQEVVETPQQRILRERREKAEKIYAELKESGHFPNMRTSSFEAFGETKPMDKHDSGISFPGSGSRMSTESKTDREDKRKGRVFLDLPDFSGRLGESPGSNTGSVVQSAISTPSRTFSHFKKHSMSNIKKRFSVDGGSDYEDDHQARKVTSRKDLNKQHKLSKRVSDLEGKLEAARRQLNEALAEPLPPPGQQRISRPKFVPGAMPSLLSERLLSGYLQPEDDTTDEDEIGKAISYLLPENESGDEVRGRSRSVRPEPKVMPTKFSQYSSTLGKGAVSKKSGKKETTVKPDGAEDFLHEALTNASEVSSSKHSAYVDEEPEEDDDMEADESTSVVSSSEPLSEVTPKPKRKPVSTTSTPVKKQAATPKPAVSKATTKKRKSLDDDDVYKPAASSAESEMEIKPRTTPKRKAVGSAPEAKNLQKTNSVAKSTPPKRAAPAIPSSAGATPQQPPAKSIKTTSTSSPSPSTQVAAPPTRTISRKAVSIASTASRLQKPKPIAHPQNNQRQSVSPPPSSAFTGVSGLDYMKSTTIATSRSPSEKKVEEEENTNPYPSVRDSAIPPMPKLPKTVRLPSGEVVNVTANSKRASSKAGSATSSRVSRSRIVKKPVNGGSIAEGGNEMKKPEEPDKLAEMKEKFEQGVRDNEKEKSGLPRSDTKTSFEWPPDVF